MDEMKNYCDGLAMDIGQIFHFAACHMWRLGFYAALQILPEAYCNPIFGDTPLIGCTENSYRQVGNPQPCCSTMNSKFYITSS